ncbi:GNAT family N-acetyltransferase [Psychrobacter phenylpyruvicus]|uniref:Phosphinothricin acetyltransferase YwnH n=1 Tax=Psychrobacter phenylpyruvicus TaxID=29432 RepID=A0A379LNL1_9GAMM|nr:GNAT family N-acetyltransferase [Psychrobacter phenylpyruvicus]SUD91382.1 Putative phosphinothricin acetyltransferase YwnH [Psychrobacter phenylpyruvicus]
MVSSINSVSKNLVPPQNLYKIRLAEPSDLPDIVTIYNQSIAGKASTADLEPVTIADRQDWFDEHLTRPNRPIYVVTNTEGVIMAWGSFSDVKNRIAYHISSEISIYVAAQFQGLGLGSLLLQWMLTQAPQLGIQNILALIFGHNEPSLALFQKFGFEFWGRFPKVCDMQGFTADLVILGKAL